MDKYLVVKLHTCDRCQGKRFIDNPAWVEIREQIAAPELAKMSQADLVQWFEEHGWAKDSYYMRPDGIPDEEVICPECDGEGEFREEAELAEVLKEYVRLGFPSPEGKRTVC